IHSAIFMISLLRSDSQLLLIDTAGILAVISILSVTHSGHRVQRRLNYRALGMTNSRLVPSVFGELAFGIIGPPFADLFIVGIFALVVQCFVGVVSFPDADFLFVVKRTGLHQFSVLAIPLPLTGHFAVVVSAYGFYK